MTDYIVGKKYRLLELHPSDIYNGIKLENKIGFIEDIFEDRLGFRLLDDDYKSLDRTDGYPKMELVEEEQKQIEDDFKAVLNDTVNRLMTDNPKKHLVEGEQRLSITFKIPSIEEQLYKIQAQANFTTLSSQSKKKHYRFKNREYIRR